MQTLRLIAAALCLCVGAFSNQTYAQTSYDLPDDYIQQEILRGQYIARYSYESWLAKARQAAKKNDMYFPFGKLLEMYSLGPDYDPLGTNAVNRLYDLAYVAQNPEAREGSEKPDEAVQKFRLLLDKHAPNYDVVTAAIPLVRDNPLLGDIEFLQWMRAGLQKRLLQSGNGAVASSAYNIYSLGEEALLFRYYNVKPVHTDVLVTQRAYYHIHLVEDVRSGKPSKIYVRLTDIMRKLETQKKLDDPSYRYVPQLPEDLGSSAAMRTE